MEYAVPKGMFDVVPCEEERWRESERWQYLETVMRSTAHEYGFKEIRTPILERTELFTRGVGESSDIVLKEMYTFIDRGERSMTMRPEGTASVIRSFVENKLYAQGSLHKFYYFGPMFRYERPQAGRFRQFHQFGVEAIGISAAEQDIEVIDLLCEINRRLGLKNLHVQINTVGDASSRAAYRKALVDYLHPFRLELSADSQTRLEKNILRILDSKDLNDQKILEKAPVLTEFLTEEAKSHFQEVLKGLEAIDIHYTINPKLVRGLDYYNKTVFEVTSEALGSQNAIGGGGRFDGLISTLGGPDLPAVGFATGIERLLQTMIKQDASFPTAIHPFVFFIPMGVSAKQLCFELVSRLRHEKVSAEIDLSGKKVQHGLQLANACHADYAVVIGEEEIASQTVKVKHMDTRETIEISLNQLITKLKSLSERSHV